MISNESFTADDLAYLEATYKLVRSRWARGDQNAPFTAEEEELTRQALKMINVIRRKGVDRVLPVRDFLLSLSA